MSLNGILTIADSGLADVSRSLAVVGQNVANAGVAGWSREVSARESITASGLGQGVRTLPTQRSLDAVLQAGVFDQNAAAAGAEVTQSALAGIDQVQGQVGGATDLASLVGALGSAFATLGTDPANQTQQAAVVSAAGSLARQVNAVAGAVAQARQDAQDQAVATVATLNATLATIGDLSNRIVTLQAAGQSAADLQNQRDAAVGTLSAIVPVRQIPQTNGDVLLVTSNGLSLPTHATSPPFQLAGATIGPSVTYPATAAVPALTLGGADVTRTVASGGGQLGATLALRDTVLPAYQGTLDEFAYTLATRMDAQGLTLFTGPGGAVPTATGPYAQSGYVGFAQQIAVNPAVASQPSLVRDGTHAVAGSPGGASAFTPNPAGGPAGFTTLISRVSDFALGTEAQAGVAQPYPAGTALGPAGDQTAGFAPALDLTGFASGLVGRMSQDTSRAAGDLSQAQALQTGLQARLASSSGVSIDTEMSAMVALQNAYGANAKIVGAVQSMWTDLLGMVR